MKSQDLGNRQVPATKQNRRLRFIAVTEGSQNCRPYIITVVRRFHDPRAITNEDAGLRCSNVGVRKSCIM
jgi:hypothetical protein